MGELDGKPFLAATKRKFSDRADEKAVELCSLWQDHLRNPKWHPFNIITDKEGNSKVCASMLKQFDFAQFKWNDHCLTLYINVDILFVLLNFVRAHRIGSVTLRNLKLACLYSFYSFPTLTEPCCLSNMMLMQTHHSISAIYGRSRCSEIAGISSCQFLYQIIQFVLVYMVWVVGDNHAKGVLVSLQFFSI